MANKTNNRIGAKKVAAIAATTVLGVTAGNAHTPNTEEPIKDNIKASSVVRALPESGENTYDAQLVVFDIGKEVSRRTDWYICNFLDSEFDHHDNIIKAHNPRVYAKNEFFHVTAPRRGLTTKDPYCISAVGRCLIDANFAGDLDGVLPNPNSPEAGSFNVCSAFVKHFKDKGFNDCIDNKVDLAKLQPGDVIITKNSRGGNHAQVIVGIKDGGPWAMGFNRNRSFLFKSQPGTVIHISKIVNRAIWNDLIRQNLISEDCNRETVIMPRDQVNAIREYLSRGCEDNEFIISERLRNSNQHDFDTSVVGAKAEVMDNQNLGLRKTKVEQNDRRRHQDRLTASLLRGRGRN